VKQTERSAATVSADLKEEKTMRPHSIVAICITLLVILTLAVSPAVAQRFGPASPTGDDGLAGGESAATGVLCQPVHGHHGATLSFEACEYQGVEYEWCLELPIWGTLNGIWHYYGNPATVYRLEAPEEVLGEGWLFGASSALAVFETNRGNVFAHENSLWHRPGPLLYTEYFTFTGGTGHYEGATGRMGIISDVAHPQGNETVETGVLFGVVCTPIEE